MLFEMSAEISGLVRGALEAVPTPPDSWHPMLRELGLGPATLVN